MTSSSSLTAALTARTKLVLCERGNSVLKRQNKLTLDHFYVDTRTGSTSKPSDWCWIENVNERNSHDCVWNQKCSLYLGVGNTMIGTSGSDNQMLCESSGARAAPNIITKTRLFKCTENFTTKEWKFSEKKIWYFSYFRSNINYGYSLEPPRRGGSNEYPQSMFWAEIRRIMYTPVNPSFTI